MALVSSFFWIRFSQKQLKIRPMSSNKRLPWLCTVVIAVKQQTKGKIYVKTRTTTRTGEKEQNEGQQTINFGTLVPHIRHLFVTNFHYDGNIRRHLEARNNQSAMRNQPTCYTFPIQSSTIHEKTDEGRSCLVEMSLKFINVVSNVSKSQCQAQIWTPTFHIVSPFYST